MIVEEIKTEDWEKRDEYGYKIATGKKIIIHMKEKEELTINEVEKIKGFFKTLRS